jgi:glycosyltransferase involved in cell wall biosynthesis
MPASLRPSLAILLGTFQGQNFLARQLDTLAAQTYTDWALWVSDDRSSDGTLDILEAYRARWGNDKLVIRSGPAQGFRANFLALACNADIQADYYAFCDQDDLWDPDKLATALAWLTKVPA